MNDKRMRMEQAAFALRMMLEEKKEYILATTSYSFKPELTDAELDAHIRQLQFNCKKVGI